MTPLEWAEKEVELACKRDESTSDKDFNYAKLCFDSAMKAYRSLNDDNHSGMSWGITRQILTRLMKNLPLTSIEDTEELWKDCSVWLGKKSWQCTRLSSLFKYEDDDGNFTYSDSNRVAAIDSNGDVVGFGLATSVIDEMYPITFPYYPTEVPYKVYFKESSSKNCKDDFDLIILSHIVKPDGTREDLNKYYKEEDRKLIEISEEEYNDLASENSNDY